ncbi:MAG: VOC family protein [Mogibacterium sp.]|nr:VOC family protein [Mogibacterium sp.]
MIKSIDHMVITTADLDACLHFYEDLLGMEHKVQGGQHALHFGDQKINLHTRPHEFHPSATNVTHGSQDFCLIADGDINSIKEKLVGAGITIIEGVVERYGAMGLMDSIYMYDPDGNLVEIAVYK